MHIPTHSFHRWMLAIPGAVALLLGACFEGPQGSSGSSYNAPNRFGYGGTVTDPSGMIRQPSTGPDGMLANAISPQPSAGNLAQANQPENPSGAHGTLTQPIIPSVNPNPPKVPDAGVNPKAPPTPTPTPPTPANNTASPNTKANPTPPSNPNPTPPPATTPKKNDYPYGIPVPGKEGLVYSPYDKAAGYVEVRNIKPGSLVECPYTHKYFRVP